MMEEVSEIAHGFKKPQDPDDVWQGICETKLELEESIALIDTARELLNGQLAGIKAVTS